MKNRAIASLAAGTAVLAGCSLFQPNVLTSGTVLKVEQEGVTAFVKSVDKLEKNQTVGMDKIIVQPAVNPTMPPWHLWRPAGDAEIVEVLGRHLVLIRPESGALVVDDEIRLNKKPGGRAGQP